MKISDDKRKMLRLLFFLLSALLVVPVSAAVYNILYIQASPISVKTAKIVFANGSDAPQAGTVIGTNGTYVKFTNLAGWPNATRVYQNASLVKNTDTAISFPCTLSRSSWSGNTGDLAQLYVQIYNSTGTWEGTLNVVAGNTTTFTLPPGQTWRVQWTIQWVATAPATDSVSVTISLQAIGQGTGE